MRALGLIAPMLQSKALLGKFVVRSILPRNDPCNLNWAAVDDAFTANVGTW